jgi:hypothetical protein
MGGIEAAGGKWFVTVVLSAFVLVVGGFATYFIFKQIQFVLQAINLYKAMVTRLDKIITLMEKNVRMTADISSKVKNISSIMTPPPLIEAPKREAPKREIPRQESPRQESPRQESPRQESPKQEAPKQEAPKQEAPKQEAPKQEAPKQEVLPLPVLVREGDSSSVLLKVNEVQGFLATLGYKVDLDGKHWAIQNRQSENVLYAYSVESLKNHVEAIASKHKITITWTD